MYPHTRKHFVSCYRKYNTIIYNNNVTILNQLQTNLIDYNFKQRSCYCQSSAALSKSFDRQTFFTITLYQIGRGILTF